MEGMRGFYAVLNGSHVVGMKPDLAVLPDDTVSVCAFGGEEASVTELDSVFQIHAHSRHG
jgi:hypothetical protein